MFDYTRATTVATFCAVGASSFSYTASLSSGGTLPSFISLDASTGTFTIYTTSNSNVGTYTISVTGWISGV